MSAFFQKLLSGEHTFSFEFFPPKTPTGWAKLYNTIAETAKLQPDLVSVTYGAGGSTRQNTTELVGTLRNNLAIDPMAHLTCVGHSLSELCRILDKLEENHCPAIMALRGDPPAGSNSFTPHRKGLAHGSELVKFIRTGWPDFKIACACYPEGHQESPSMEQDVKFLKEKQDCGADFAITQLFFDNAKYYTFVEKARQAGVTIPLIPGIMPLTSPAQIEKFTSLSGCSIPSKLREAASSADPAASGYAFALEQCKDLLANGAPGIHFYTLNQSSVSGSLMSALKD